MQLLCSLSLPPLFYYWILEQDLTQYFRQREFKSLSFTLFGGRVAQWLEHRTCDTTVAGLIQTTAHVAIALGKQFTSIFLGSPIAAKWVTSHRQLKYIDH